MADAPLARGFSRQQPPEPDDDQPTEGATVSIVADGPALAPQSNADGSLSIPTEDGGVVIHYDWKKPKSEGGKKDHFANLAEDLDGDTAARIVEEVMRGIEADLASRQEWEDMRAEGIKMLGLVLEKPRGDPGGSTEPFEGMSTIRHPLLIEAIARFQANAAAELYPPTGPVKVRDDRPSRPQGASPDNSPGSMEGLTAVVGQQLLDPPPARDEIAEALERGFNHNLTSVDRGYRPDSVKMLFYVAFDGCAFKKVYDCPIKQRPVSRFVPAKDVIVSNAVSHEQDAGRITHRITMEKSVMKVMQIAGVYTDDELSEPNYEPDRISEAEGQAQGIEARPQRQEDQPFTIYESYVQLDVRGFEHERDGRKTGLPLPYKVSIDKDARRLKELRRNWEEDDDTYQPRRCLVKFGFIPAFGFYDLGLLHLLGNGDKALTAAWRIALDCGMFNNFPGFMYNEGAVRNWTNQNRVPPGGGIAIKGIGNLPLDQVIKALPYKDISQGLIAFITHMEQRMDRLAMTAQLPIGEGNQDAPVGTTLAMIEQATKVMQAVHVGLHASLADEIELLKDRYAQNPKAFWRWNKKKLYDWEEELFFRALQDNEIVPASDVNTPSHMMRIMRAWAIVQLAQVAPALFKPKQAARRFFEMIRMPDPDEFLADDVQPGSEPPPQVDPNRMAATQAKVQQAQTEAQGKMAEIQAKAQQAAQEHAARLVEMQTDAQNEERTRQLSAQANVVESADRAADRASRERVAAMRIEAERDRLNAEQQKHQVDTAAEDRRHAIDTVVKPHVEAQAAALQNPPGAPKQTGSKGGRVASKEKK